MYCISIQVKYNKNQDNSSISTLRSQVTDVKNAMTQNIDKILESEERSNIFPDSTDDLQTAVSDAHLSRYPHSALSHRITALETECQKQEHTQGYCEIILSPDYGFIEKLLECN